MSKKTKKQQQDEELLLSSSKPGMLTDSEPFSTDPTETAKGLGILSPLSQAVSQAFDDHLSALQTQSHEVSQQLAREQAYREASANRSLAEEAYQSATQSNDTSARGSLGNSAEASGVSFGSGVSQSSSSGLSSWEAAQSVAIGAEAGGHASSLSGDSAVQKASSWASSTQQITGSETAPLVQTNSITEEGMSQSASRTIQLELPNGTVHSTSYSLSESISHDGAQSSVASSLSHNVNRGDSGYEQTFDAGGASARMNGLDSISLSVGSASSIGFSEGTSSQTFDAGGASAQLNGKETFGENALGQSAGFETAMQGMVESASGQVIESGGSSAQLNGADLSDAFKTTTDSSFSEGFAEASSTEAVSFGVTYPVTNKMLEVEQNIDTVNTLALSQDAPLSLSNTLTVLDNVTLEAQALANYNRDGAPEVSQVGDAIAASVPDTTALREANGHVEMATLQGWHGRLEEAAQSLEQAQQALQGTAYEGSAYDESIGGLKEALFQGDAQAVKEALTDLRGAEQDLSKVLVSEAAYQLGEPDFVQARGEVMQAALAQEEHLQQSRSQGMNENVQDRFHEQSVNGRMAESHSLEGSVETMSKEMTNQRAQAERSERQEPAAAEQQAAEMDMGGD